ncbi:MAG: class I SAM-dependent methyltransferase [Anaerolineales bacterium]
MKNKFLRSLMFRIMYLFSPRWDTGIPVPELVRFVANNAPGNALDLGCGTGTNLRYLADHGWKVTGIDFVPRAIRQARKKLKDYPAALLLKDVSRLESLELPGPYDLLLDVGCFHTLSSENRQKVLAGINRWLKPGGNIMIYAFQPGDEGNSTGIRKQEMIDLFKQGFDLVNYEQGQGRPSAWYYFRRKFDDNET